MRTPQLRSICVALAALGLWLLTGERTYAQPISSYTFTASSGTYTAITGTSLTASNTNNIDDQNFTAVTLPFTFTYHGVPFTSVGIDANGYIQMGGTSQTSYTALSTWTDVIGGLAEDFYSLSTTTGRDISYTTTGSAPNRVFTVQWTNWGFWSSGLADFNFQIKLYETSNQIQFVYGAFPMASAPSFPENPQVGLTGATLTDFKVLTTTSSWSAPTIAGSNTASMTLSSSVAPASGQTYTFAPPAPCTGTPPAGTAVISAASVCPNTAFSVTWNGSTTAVGGLSYQLQTSSTGVPASYANSGAAQTNPTFTISGITATTYYRIVVTCTSTGGGTATSVADTVTVNPATQCYCAPPSTVLHSFINDYFTNVTIAGTTLNSSNGTNATTGYLQISAPPASNTASMVLGTQYTITATHGSQGAPFMAAIWIDFNADGQFNTTNEYIPMTIGTSTSTATFTVPVGATPSLTGLRVRARGGTVTSDACLTYGSGETEDYLVTLVAPVPCSGTPLAGSANTSNANPCPGTQVNISISGGTIATGINFQLQSSTTSATTGFANVGATNNTGIFTVTPGAGNTWYRIVSTCTNTGGGTATSTSVQVTGQSAITTLPWNDGLESVTTTGTNFPQCWKRINGDWATQDASWWFYNDPRTGIRYLTNGVSGTQNEWIMTPGFQLTGGTSYDFSFYWVGDGFSGWTGDVGVNSIQDSTGATILGTPFVTSTTSTNATAYQQVIRTFTPTTTGTYFFGVRVGDNFNGSNLGFDDFRVNVTPTCPQPVMGTVAPITATGATINWTPATTTNPSLGYQIEVRTSGLPGSGATGLAWSGTAGSTATSAPATGLTGTTNYTAYVRAICSPGDSSFWSSTTFTTTLDCTTATVITGCGQSQTFTVGTTGAYNPVQTPTGPNIFTTPGGEKLYVYTAPVTGAYTLDVSATNFVYVDYFFKAATGGCGNTNWNFIDDVISPTGVPNFITFNLTAGTQYYFLADNESNSSSATQTFAINCPATCGVPTNVNVTTTTTTAQVSWTQNPPGTPTAWQISYGVGITSPQAGTIVPATANPFTITGLTASTTYTFFVRAICGPGDSSQWSASFTAPTQCVAVNLPYLETFTSATFPPACWSRAQGALTANSTLVNGSSFWNHDSYLNAGFISNAAKVNIYSDPAFFPMREWLISPSIDLGPTPGNFQLEFDFGVVQWTTTTPAALGTDDTLAVVVSTNNGQTWSTANAIQVFTGSNTPPNTTTGGQRYYIPMNGYSGTIRVGFYGSNGSIGQTADNDVFIDSVRIISTCTPPNLALGNDTTVCGNVTSLILDAGSAPAGTTYTWTNSFNSATATTQTLEAAPVLNALNANPNNLVNVVTFFSTVTVGPNCAKSDTISVAVTYTPRVSSITAVPTGVVPNQYSFSPVGDSFATGYVWSFGLGGVASTPNATFTYTTPGTYNVRLIVSNPCGNDTVFTTVTITAGVEDALGDGSNVTIFPNPTAADAVLEVTGGATLRSYQVMSATGALVQESTIKGKGVTSTKLNTDALAPGVYTLRIQLDKGVVVRKLEVLK